MLFLKLLENILNYTLNSIIAGYRNGFFNSNEEKDIVEEIIHSKANILFVAMSSPKKEIFLNKFKYAIKGC